MLHKSDYVGEGVPLINPINIVEGFIIPDHDKKVGSDALTRLAPYALNAGDVIVGRRGEIGRCAVVQESQRHWVCGTGCFFIRPKESIDSHFLAQLIRSPRYRDQLERSATGTTMSNVSNSALASLLLKVPDLPTQRRIVAILDRAFEGIATAKANAEQNVRKAREVFETALQLLLKDCQDGLSRHTLTGVCDIRSKLIDPREAQYLSLPHIGAGNIESMTGAILDVKTAREEQLISGKFLFDESTVLYSKIRPYLMKVVRPDFYGLCSADIYPLVPKVGRIARDYLFYLLLTPGFTEYAVKGSARAGMPKVNREHLFAYEFSLPRIQEQVRIAARLDALAEDTQRLSEICEKKLAALDELKRSLLHRAFAGEL